LTEIFRVAKQLNFEKGFLAIKKPKKPFLNFSLKVQNIPGQKTVFKGPENCYYNFYQQKTKLIDLDRKQLKNTGNFRHITNKPVSWPKLQAPTKLKTFGLLTNLEI
jgi:hypothetical protein